MNRREYLANTSLMLGYGLSFGAIATLYQSCKQESFRSNGNSFSFNEDQKKLISMLVDTILPRTDSPGAIDVKVPAFIELMLAKVWSDEDKKEFLQSLAAFESEFHDYTKKRFFQSSIEEKVAYLTHLDKTSPSFPPVMWGIVLVEKPIPVGFFRKLKALTLMGYYTSQEIG
jgi:hypothetical protein